LEDDQKSGFDYALCTKYLDEAGRNLGLVAYEIFHYESDQPEELQHFS